MTRTDPTPDAPDLDRYLEPFEAARLAGDDPDLTAFLPPADDPAYLPVLRELVRVDLEFAWDAGEGRRLDSYRDRFPVLFADPESARAIAWEEFRLREAAGEDPTLAEYQARFGVDLSHLVGRGPEETASLAAAETTAFEVAPPDGHRYELVAELARGGMGIVYRAHDRALNREVAVKALRDPAGPVPGAARRLAEEARITGRLQHPGVPAVHDLGTLPDG